MSNRISLKLTFAMDIISPAAGMALVIQIVFGAMVVPTVQAQSPPNSAASESVAGSKFEVASIKTAAGCIGGRGRGGGSSSPGRVDLRCTTVMTLIRRAYILFADGKLDPQRQGVPILEGPGWINSDRFDIDAKAEGAPTLEMMNGPMMQELLADRFNLRIHRETREVSVYALTVAKGGLKLQAAQAGRCAVLELSQPPTQPTAHLPTCGGIHPESDGVHIYGATMKDLVGQFSALFGQDVVDKTGIPGTFDFHFDVDLDKLRQAYAPSADGAQPADARKVLADELMATGIPALGLKLVSTKAPGQFLVIDRVERPSAN